MWEPVINISNANSQNPIVNPGETTTYTVTASSGSCQNSTQSITVIVNPNPIAEAGDYLHVVRGELVKLAVDSSGNVTYNWTPPGGLSCFDCAEPSFTAEETTTFTVTVTDENGCITIDEVTVYVTDVCGEDIFVANAFTPNGDDFNDKVFVRNLTLGEIETFRLYNRWGELMFETNDENEGWDGRKNGKMQDPGVYVWYLKATCTNGQVVERKGNVTLLK